MELGRSCCAGQLTRKVGRRLIFRAVLRIELYTGGECCEADTIVHHQNVIAQSLAGGDVSAL